MYHLYRHPYFTDEYFLPNDNNNTITRRTSDFDYLCKSVFTALIPTSQRKAMQSSPIATFNELPTIELIAELYPELLI
jgi:hypothetical protein